MVAFGKHLARLSLWTDTYRSAAFCAVSAVLRTHHLLCSQFFSFTKVYFIAWFLNLLLPAIFTLLAVLIAFPPARSILFPPERLSIVPPSSGNKPAPPTLGEDHSHDTLTGAPEAQKGEAAEKEASNFVGGLAQVAVGVASGTGEPSPHFSREWAHADGAASRAD